MIELTCNNHNRTKVYLAHDAMACFTEADTSSQWHGTRSIVKTFNGETLEICESVQEIVKKLAECNRKHTEEQIELVIQLIATEVSIAKHPKTPPNHWFEERERLREDLRNTAKEKQDVLE